MDILKEIRRQGGCSISNEVIESMIEFKELKSNGSLESLVLEMEGHSPITNSFFSIKKLELWSEKNNINVVYDEKKRFYHFYIK
jgi:hypothetical protein